MKGPETERCPISGYGFSLRWNPCLGQGIKRDFHGANRAASHTEAAGRTFFRIKDDLHARTLDVQGANRTDASAGPALETFAFIAMDLTGKAFRLHAETLQIIKGISDFLFLSLEFHHHDAVPLGTNIRFQDIELYYIALNQMVDNGLIRRVFRITEEVYSGHCTGSMLKIQEFVQNSRYVRSAFQQT